MKVPQEGACSACCCDNAVQNTCSVVATGKNAAADFTVKWTCLPSDSADLEHSTFLPPTSVATTLPPCVTCPDVDLLVSEACFPNIYLQLNFAGTFADSIKGLINVDCISAKQCFYLYGYFNPKTCKYIYFCKLESFYLTSCPKNLKSRGKWSIKTK